MEQQERDGRHQAEGGGVHGNGNTAGEHIGLLGGIGLGHGGKGGDQTDDGPEQAEQGGDVGQGCEVGRALFQAGHGFHNALFHGQFNIVPALGLTHTRHPRADDTGDGGAGGLPQFHHAGVVTLFQQWHQLLKRLTVGTFGVAEIEPALQCDRQAHHQHDGNRVHKGAAVLKKAQRYSDKVHANCPQDSSVSSVLSLPVGKGPSFVVVSGCRPPGDYADLATANL